MRNEDNECIRYLMKEMDPSEELLMERAMMEDEDLLIEVESMRQTLQKLDRLPELAPPPNVRNSVMEKAAEQARKNRKNNRSFANPFRYAVAATLALTITAGGAWFMVGSDTDRKQQAVTASTSSSSAPAEVSERSGTAQLASTNNTNTSKSSNTTVVQGNIGQVASSENSGVDPWIDRNDIIRFEDHLSGQNEQFKALLERSTRKLQLIENPGVGNGRVNSIQLLGQLISGFTFLKLLYFFILCCNFDHDKE